MTTTHRQQIIDLHLRIAGLEDEVICTENDYAEYRAKVEESLATVEEAANVLASAAKYNFSLGRTVMAHVQQDRAERLESILKKLA